MNTQFNRRSRIRSRPEWVTRIAGALCILALASTAMGCASNTTPTPTTTTTTTTTTPTATEEDRPGKIEPRYQPREPLEPPFYDDTYLFAMTRGVANSTIHPAGQVPLLFLTIPLDIAFLPFAAIGGFF